jgi:hypothetical protein
VPSAEDVDRHDLLWTACGVVSQSRHVHDRGAALGRRPDCLQIQEVQAINAVEPCHLVAQAHQVASDQGTNVPAMPGNENAHATMIRRVAAATGADSNGDSNTSGRRRAAATGDSA